MVRLRNYYHSIENVAAFITKWVKYIGAIGVVLSILTLILSQFFSWLEGGAFSVLRDNLLWLWLLSLSAAFFSLWIWTSIIFRRFASGFRDDFKTLNNWDFRGDWNIVEPGTLLVAGSSVAGYDQCGLTKAGSYWENYTLSFKAKIMNDCLGVVVRAMNFDNYFMFQINEDRIRPHRRILISFIQGSTTSDQINDGIKSHLVEQRIMWIHDRFSLPEKGHGEQDEELNKGLLRPEVIAQFAAVPLSPKLEGWFDVRLKVHGKEAKLYINGDLKLHLKSFLEISTGKIGFRNVGQEKALVKDVRVDLHN